MERNCNSTDMISYYKNALEILSQSTDDYLFLLDVKNNVNWFFGDIDKKYPLQYHGKNSNSMEDIADIVHPSDRSALLEDVKKIAAGEKTLHNMEYRMITKTGDTVWVSCRGKAIKENDTLIMMGRVSEHALKHKYNQLTGLFNQSRMITDIEELLKSKKSGQVILFDIDDMSEINVSKGRKYGDELLKQFALVLEQIDFPEKKIYHTERDYFALCLVGGDTDAIMSIYDRVKEKLKDKCTVSAGVVPLDSGVFVDENNLYDCAKVMLKKAKDNGKNTIEFFSSEELENMVCQAELLEELHDRVANGFGGFKLLFQPQVKSGTYTLCSAEALLRYVSKSQKMIYPDKFIPLLESSKLIIPVGLWVLEKALLCCKQWRRYLKNMRISVNFSVVQLKCESIVDDVISVLKKTEMPGECLTIEITESVPTNEIDQIGDVIKQFKNVGISVAIDDFGTGYSNLGYLRGLNVDEIKIDRMFVKDIEEDTYNYMVISNTVNFAKMNSVKICCEGVEKASELEILESLSPDAIQGYLFDKPCDEDVFFEKYFNTTSGEFSKRESFLEMLNKNRGYLGILRFDAKEILRETDIGLWIIRINDEQKYYELNGDSTMERILGVDKKYTPKELYDFWVSRVKENWLDYVSKNVKRMIESDEMVHLEYEWSHPQMGDILVHCSGRGIKGCDGVVALKGYHRIMYESVKK